MKSNQFPIEVSARHIHLSKEDFFVLCGEDAVMTEVKPLSQPGQFQSNIRLEIVGPKRTLVNVSVLGPFRKQTQIEISLTDARSIGVNAPIRESGDLNFSAPIILRGPKGEITLNEGTIIAKRHIHMTEKDAKNLDVKNGDIVKVLIDTPERRTILDDVVVRVSDSYALAMHIDTDEGNAVNLVQNVYGEIIK